MANAQSRPMHLADPLRNIFKVISLSSLLFALGHTLLILFFSLWSRSLLISGLHILLNPRRLLEPATPHST